MSSAENKKRDIALTVLTLVGLTIGLTVSMAAGLAAAAYGYDAAFKDRIFPGVRAGSIKLDGLTMDSARVRLETAINQQLDPGFTFRFKDQTITLQRATIPLGGPDASQDLVRYNVDSAIQEAVNAGRSGNFLHDALERMRIYVQHKDIALRADTNKALVARLLQSEIDKNVQAPKDAALHISVATSSKIDITIDPEQRGTLADIDAAVNTLAAQADRLAFQPIRIQSSDIVPQIGADDLSNLQNQIPDILSHAPFTLKMEDRTFKVTTSTLAEWIDASSTQDGTVLQLNPIRVAEALAPAAKGLTQDAKDGFLELNPDNTIKQFDAPAEGVSIDGNATIANILEGWEAGSSTMNAVLSKVVPKINGADAERLGIKERLGTGVSNFSGSPTNRRKNIALGRQKMNGVLIPPGGIFSQLQVLGAVDGEHGWLPELVIKGDKTTPEFGGGLCQVGTTSFRMAMQAGLPIVERQNHSYRVRYYEPAGTDATIYDPAPDFKFKNDTPNWILITTETRNDYLYFTAWGTNDGRKASQTTPKVYNIVQPPPTKTILTTELPVGQKKCTETAHAGATASFDYSVTYASGEKKDQTFTSYYRPWGAVCLIGATAEEIVASQAAPTTPVDETGINNPN